MASKSNKILLGRSMILLLIVIILGFGSCIFYLGYVQLVKGEEYRTKAELNQLQDTEISAERGIIYDRNMKELAKSASAWKIIIRPNRFGDESVKSTVAKRLSEILEISEKSVRDKIDLNQYGWLVVKYRVEKDMRDEVLKFMDESHQDSEGKTIKYSSYIGVESDVKRYYPYGSFASTVIGFTGNSEEGKSGLELKYNESLTGVPGRVITAVNGGSRNDTMPSEYETIYDPKQGISIVTTLDETIQRYLEESLHQAQKDTQCLSAYGVVMDINTGAILGMSNKPDYDSNDPYTITDSRINAEIQKIANAKEKEKAEVNAWFSQWRNRAVSDTYEPGSVFKIVTASAALEENVSNESVTYNCTGVIQVEDRRMHCSHLEGHGLQTFREAFANSCNPFFINLGVQMGKDIFSKYFEAFGFTESTGIDLPAESKPVANVTYHPWKTMTTVQLASSAFGQSFQVSPIQMITAVSAIANGGKLLKPYLVSSMIDSDGNTILATKTTVKRQVISESTAKTIASMMEDVVRIGTGKNAYVPGYRIAGKTGTSEKLGSQNGKYVASFVCFAPADDPKVACLIAIDEPVGEYYGSQVAAPVAVDVMKKIMVYLNVEPKYTQEEQSLIETNVPNVMGKDVSSTKSQLEKDGFTIRVIGSGDKVIDQVPGYNQTIPKNGTIILYTENKGKQMTTVPSFAGMTISDVYKTANKFGINVEISGNALGSGQFTVFRQSIEPNTSVEYGKMVTVYFKAQSSDEDVD